jgi:outer membrane protein TolC
VPRSINSRMNWMLRCGLVVAAVGTGAVWAQERLRKNDSDADAPVIASFAPTPSAAGISATGAPTANVPALPSASAAAPAASSLPGGWSSAAATPPAVNAPDPPANAPPAAGENLPVPGVPNVPLAAGDKPLPIDLPSALRLGHAEALDIQIASQQWRAAVAQLQGAWALWLPNIVSGGEYIYHAGPVQGSTGTTTSADRSSLYAGFAPLVQLTLTDAIFTPLAARQTARAQRANIQTNTNDTLRSVALAYFDAEEARADLGSVQDVLVKVRALMNKVDSLAPDLIPTVEKARVRAQYANVEQIAETARARWRVASAELVRILRLEPTLVVEPVEPPNLQITLISPDTPPEELIPLAVERRPEVTFAEAQMLAASERVRQEKWRPFLPTFFLRGDGTQNPDPLMVGTYGAGTNSDLAPFGSRLDLDTQLIWELQGLGFGNLALIHEREANFEQTERQRHRVRELVAREVAQYHADVVAAAARAKQAERELQQATVSANENLAGVGEIKRVGGNINVLVIRPQEAVSAIQQLASAYFDYFGAIADYNRAQFQLYRAMGNPADMVYRELAPQGNAMPNPGANAAPNPGPDLGPNPNANPNPPPPPMGPGMR